MVVYIVLRCIMLVSVLFLISVVSFVIIELRSGGNWVSAHIENLRASGLQLNEQEAELLMTMYGFDKPAWQRYLRWMNHILRFNFGWSFRLSGF